MSHIIDPIYNTTFRDVIDGCISYISIYYTIIILLSGGVNVGLSLPVSYVIGLRFNIRYIFAGIQCRHLS